MNEDQLRKLMTENAKQAGFYRGLLEGLLWQCKADGNQYTVSSSVYRKVAESFEKAKKDFGEGACTMKD